MRLLLGLAMLGLTALQPATARVTVRVLDIRPEKGGVLRTGLYRAPGDGFPGRAPFANMDASPAASESTLTFDVVPGKIAVAVHHDANANGKLDTNFIGIPREGYGFSNDPRPRFRAPRFSEAQVQVTRDTTLVVHMVY
jgi:uncharacterized protein (DUF2141 family)